MRAKPALVHRSRDGAQSFHLGFIQIMLVRVFLAVCADSS